MVCIYLVVIICGEWLTVQFLSVRKEPVHNHTAKIRPERLPTAAPWKVSHWHIHQDIPAWELFPHGPLTKCVKLPVVHVLGMPGTFYPPPTSKESASLRSQHASRHVCHVRAVMHVGIANLRWKGKRSRHPQRMRNPQFTYLARDRLQAQPSDMNLHGAQATSN